jgi:hypothetical protein
MDGHGPDLEPRTMASLLDELARRRLPRSRWAVPSGWHAISSRGA